MQKAQPEETLLWAISSDLINRAGRMTFLIDLIITWACQKKTPTKKPHLKTSHPYWNISSDKDSTL